MAQISKIQWTDATWNVAVGCSKVDKDCLYCYMYRQSLNGTRYAPDQVIQTKGVFRFPLKYKETASRVWSGRPLIFTSSLTDFFHKDVDAFRAEAWDIIRKCPHLIFQILTKRPERILECLPDDWGDGWDNVWLGTSVGSSDSEGRIFTLAKVPAKIRFISFEPLHARVNCNFDMSLMRQFHWIIVGGESGNDNGKYKYRPCYLDWIEEIVESWSLMGAAVFVKQLGTYLATMNNLNDRHGGDMYEWPEFINHLKVRQFPVEDKYVDGKYQVSFDEFGMP